MGIRRQYRKRSDQFVVAVQLDLDTTGFTYRKWGAEQQCKKGDWIVDNDGDIYSVDGDVFAKTYRNPLRAGIVKRLAAYRWSSYSAFAYGKPAPGWLSTQLILSQFAGENQHKL
jgi:hypothetical protein